VNATSTQDDPGFQLTLERTQRLDRLIKYPPVCWTTVCKTVRPMLSDRCLSCPVMSDLSVTLVYCGQTVRWVKMKLCTQVGLGTGNTVLDGDPAPKGHSPSKFSSYVCCGQMAGARHCGSGRQPNFATLNRGRHLYSAGRPSCWALTHILVIL